ncbi:mitochondrion protein [Naematelia encephala]|uniref:Mitochondrion protein n=1 Tax=Naematelia encephala TaxID=71784 RepID=A0A1Y2AFH2_9TREE|nr:mitochondrion protein [Naematelia encephala]
MSSLRTSIINFRSIFILDIPKNRIPIKVQKRGWASKSQYHVTANEAVGTGTGAGLGAGAGTGTGNGSGSAYTPPSAFRKWGVRFALALAFPAVFFLGAAFPPRLILFVFPRHAPPPPEKDSHHGKALMNEVEKELQGLYVVAQMRGKEGWYETRPYQRFDPQKVHNSLTAGSLRGPGKLAVPPLLFAKHDESEAVAVIHLGRALCGHDGIIHGGLIATVFDESLARNALLNLPTHIGVTASLTVNYKAPCQADQFVIVRTKIENVNGRKAMVSGTMETLDGDKVAEAKALFVEPKWAQFLQSSGVTEALGRPMPSPQKSPAIMDASTERII